MRIGFDRSLRVRFDLGASPGEPARLFWLTKSFESPEDYATEC